MRNSDLGGDYATHLNAHLFVTPDLFLELDRGIAQEDYNGNAAGRDPLWDDDVLNNIDPKVVRIETDVVNGHTVGGELHFRGGEHVVLGGTEGDDIMTGDRGIDTLWGDAGDDYLNGMTEADEVFGGLGDDIIEDPFGDNFLRGNQGNDVISVARGFNVLFGGAGKDAILLGQDFSEVFGGEGNDFILGSSGPDVLLGNEGDDWIEGAASFDGMTGDNSELFFNSTVIGHDILWAQGDDADYDGESGDDIMISGPGVHRMEGMFGFDWAIAKYDTSTQVEIDLNRIPGLAVAGDILRDRFDHVEAASGWNRDDNIFGDDRGHVAGQIVPTATPDPTLAPELLFINDELTNANVGLIRGLDAWLGDGALDVRNTLFGSPTADFREGNFLMGGGGSDTLAGRGGFDIIDGDAWLNVRIELVRNGVTYTAESMNTDQSVAGPLAGRVFNLDGTQAFNGRSLISLLLDRTFNPGSMTAVREVLYNSSRHRHRPLRRQPRRLRDRGRRHRGDRRRAAAQRPRRQRRRLHLGPRPRQRPGSGRRRRRSPGRGRQDRGRRHRLHQERRALRLRRPDHHGRRRGRPPAARRRRHADHGPRPDPGGPGRQQRSGPEHGDRHAGRPRGNLLARRRQQRRPRGRRQRRRSPRPPPSATTRPAR